MSFDPSLPDDGVNVSDTHPLREALVLVAGIAGVGVALFAVVAGLVELLVPLIPASVEARVFARSAIPEVFGPEAEAAADPHAERVAQLLERLARHWSDNPYAFRVAVYEESTPNALALPGGVIVVTSGLLDRVASENELAFVLAHELGHFHDRDHLRGIGRSVAFRLVLVAFGAGGGSGAAQLAALSGRLAERGFGRDQERDADAFALALVQQEYGHVAGAADFFERLPQPEGVVGKGIAHYLSTHPLNDERIEALRALAAERGWPPVGPVTPLGRD